jgi:hypothetical protein
MRVGTNGGPKDIASATETAVRILREIDQIDVEQLDEIVAHTMQMDSDELKTASTEDSPIKQIKAYLRSYDLRRNAVTRNIELNGQPINDTDLNNIYVACLENFGKKEVNMQLVNAIVDSDFVVTYNPFLELQACRAITRLLSWCYAAIKESARPTFSGTYSLLNCGPITGNPNWMQARTTRSSCARRLSSAMTSSGANQSRRPRN